jgi:threonine/homoserine/homoserine lactone efflux protein
MTNYFLPLLFGIFSSSFGIAFPGLINMTAAKVSLHDGRDRALLFVFGAVIIIFFQTLIAILFARFIDSRPDVINLLREVGLGIFIALTIYFFFIAKKPKLKNKELKARSKTNRFFLGMLLSSLNFFPIPYYVFVTITLASYQLFSFESLPIFTYLIGVVIGSFTVFYYYITYFVKSETKTDFFVMNINKIIGTITGIVSLITLINIIKYYF